MKTTIILLGIVAFLTACSKNDCTQEIPEWCHRADISNTYDPVCGCDGKTYQNAGHADCIGAVEAYTEGACE